MTSRHFSYRLRVPLHDIDAAGVMFYAHLFRHAHDAYEAFMGSIGLPLDEIIRDQDWRLPLAHAEADYRMPLRHGDALEIQLCVSALGQSSFALGYRFVDERSRVCAVARTVHVHFAPEPGTAAPLPKALATALHDWLCDEDGNRR